MVGKGFRALDRQRDEGGAGRGLGLVARGDDGAFEQSAMFSEERWHAKGPFSTTRQDRKLCKCPIRFRQNPLVEPHFQINAAMSIGPARR